MIDACSASTQWNVQVLPILRMENAVASQGACIFRKPQTSVPVWWAARVRTVHCWVPSLSIFHGVRSMNLIRLLVDT